MRTMTVLLTLFVLLGFVNSPASGEIMVKDFDQLKDVQWFKVYMRGVGTGYAHANSELRVNKQKQLYCQPGNLALTVDNYLRILDDEIQERRKEGQYIEDIPVELLLLKGLQKTFPCNK